MNSRPFSVKIPDLSHLKVLNQTNAMNKQVQDAFKAAKAGFSNFGTGITETAGNIGGAVTDTATGALETGGDALGQVTGGITGTVTDVVTDLPTQIQGAVTDPLGTATTVLGNTGDALQDAIGIVSDPILEGMQTGGNIISSNLNDALGVVTGGLGDITDQIGIGGSTLDTLTAIGGGLDDIMGPINDTIWDAMGGINTSIADGLDTITGPFRPKGGGTKVDLKKMKSRKGRLKNKNIANLRVNKSKGRARQSLRIG